MGFLHSAVAPAYWKMNLFWQSPELGKHSAPEERWEGSRAVRLSCRVSSVCVLITGLITV